MQTTDFFPPIVDDPFLYGQIAAANAMSDVYAMGGEPKLALNILCIPSRWSRGPCRRSCGGATTKPTRRGPSSPGGHTIHGAEPIYGLAVSGFVHPKKVLKNCGARPGDVLLLTKPLGIGILTTAAKADLVEPPVLKRIYRQMATLNKAARDIMVRYPVHSCTDVTGFALLGHSFEMAQGGGCSIHIQTDRVAFSRRGLSPGWNGLYPCRSLPQPGLRPGRGGGARRRQPSHAGHSVRPQTSGGLLMALPEADAQSLSGRARDVLPQATAIGYVTEHKQAWICLE